MCTFHLPYMLYVFLEETKYRRTKNEKRPLKTNVNKHKQYHITIVIKTYIILYWNFYIPDVMKI